MPREIVYFARRDNSENGKYFIKSRYGNNTILKSYCHRGQKWSIQVIRIPKKVSSPLAEAQQDPGKIQE